MTVLIINILKLIHINQQQSNIRIPIARHYIVEKVIHGATIGNISKGIGKSLVLYFNAQFLCNKPCKT